MEAAWCDDAGEKENAGVRVRRVWSVAVEVIAGVGSEDGRVEQRMGGRLDPFVGHCCELPADGLQGEKGSAMHDRDRSMHSGYSRAEPEVSTLLKNGTFYFALTV